MKTKIFTLCVAVLFISSVSFAAIRRVGYNGIALSGVDYANFQSAHDASSAGDTIQIYSSPGSGTITKQLVIMGFGYNFDANPNLQVIGTDAPSNISLNFYLGSDGSTVEGCSGSFSISPYDPNTGTGNGSLVSNITFQRCYGTFYFSNYESYGPSSNVKIISCVITGGGMFYSGVNDYPVTNLQVYNCILESTFTLYKASTTASFINCAMPSPSVIGNQSLNLNDAGVLVKNCILAASGAASNVNTVFESNFFGEAQPATLPSGSNNRWSQDWATLFTRNGRTDDNAGYYGYAEFDEDYFVLKTGSPAINGGTDAANNPTDAGIYGGELAYRYKLSGVPAVPAIYKLTAPSNSASTNPYNVTISVRSNN